MDPAFFETTPQFSPDFPLDAGLTSPEESDGLETPYLAPEDLESSYISHAQREIFSVLRPQPLSNDWVSGFLHKTGNDKELPFAPQDCKFPSPFPTPDPAFQDYERHDTIDPYGIDENFNLSPPLAPPHTPEEPEHEIAIPPYPGFDFDIERQASRYSSRFESGHRLNTHFVAAYELEDELGAGGYGFVMTARQRAGGDEVAIKFIYKKKVPESAWMVDELAGRIPTEVMLCSIIEHDAIIKCLDLYDDDVYYYMVQELHGSPWPKAQRLAPQRAKTVPKPLVIPQVPSLRSGEDTLDSPVELELETPPQPYVGLPLVAIHGENSSTDNPSARHAPRNPPKKSRASLPLPSRPVFTHRPSHDLFECIEQSPLKRLSEKDAKYIFRQVVGAVDFLESYGISHRDIKDENLVIDKNLKVKLIDFGSAIVADPSKPRPYYDLFFGTAAYACPEILLKRSYQAAPAEIWTLGVLLSFLMTGMSPFPHQKDAIRGRIVLNDRADISDACLSLMRHCLEPDPKLRYTIAEVHKHRWLADD